ncbi:wax ester/triacylglycerol synthase family O-acyltransferase [uncultured Abyssibacter sp.]|uniref:WS/DGAT/MGAT family O-acyltransferase n=1 Tax=uncultured Abyssibacter sp. TaxID=2320202 RepID=UPI0032B1267A
MSIPIAPTDAAWLYAEKADMPTHIGCLSIFRIPDAAPESYLLDLVDSFRSTRIFSLPFNYVLKRSGIGKLLPFWEVLEPDRIDLDYHLRHSALPRPGGERELGTLVSRLHSYPLDRSRPLWEFHVIEGLERNRFALYLKAHHSLVDGVAGTRILRRMLSDRSEAGLGGPPWSFAERDLPDLGVAAPARPRSQPALLDTLKLQGAAAWAAGKALAGQWRASEDEIVRPFAAPITPLNRRIGGKRRFATQNYALERIQRIARRADVSINDVFMALCSAALRRYLGELGKLPDESLVAGMPVSYRNAEDTRAGNAISFILSSLHTDLAEPVERLRACHESARAAKDSLTGLSSDSMNQYTMLFMAPYMMQIVLGVGGYARPMHNLILSNVPGPAEALYLNGATLEEIYPISLLFNGEALNISVLSYNNRFNVGFTGCRDSLPHMQRIAVYTGEALVELEKALKIRRRRTS